MIPPQEVGSLNDKAKMWLKTNRGISEATAERFKLKSDTKWFPAKDTTPAGERGCIAFPYFRSGSIVNHKYRDALKCFRMDTDAELIPYNLDSLTGQTEVVITEGEIDTLSIYEAGYTGGIISVPSGANVYRNNMEWLDGSYNRFDKITRIVIAVDTDVAGEHLKADLIRRFGAQRCYILTWPEGVKDANEALMTYGSEFIIQAIAEAQPLPMEGIYTEAEIEELVDKIYDNGLPRGIKLGWQKFDALCQWLQGEFIVVTGVPSHGKSVWCENVMVRQAMNNGWKFGVWVAEVDPEAMVMNLIHQITGQRIIGSNKIHHEEYKAVKQFIAKHFYFFKIADTKNTLDGIISKGTELVQRYGIDALFIDPWSYIEKDMGNLSESQFFEKCLPKMKQFRVRNNCSLMVVAHPRKMDRDMKTKVVRVPEPYDISGSSQWYGAPDKIFTVWSATDENGKYSHHEIYIMKQKKWWLGSKGMVHMKLDLINGRFNEVDPEAPRMTQVNNPDNTIEPDSTQDIVPF
jgi:twinkle protein